MVEIDNFYSFLLLFLTKDNETSGIIINVVERIVYQLSTSLIFVVVVVNGIFNCKYFDIGNNLYSSLLS